MFRKFFKRKQQYLVRARRICARNAHLLLLMLVQVRNMLTLHPQSNDLSSFIAIQHACTHQVPSSYTVTFSTCSSRRESAVVRSRSPSSRYVLCVQTLSHLNVSDLCLLTALLNFPLLRATPSCQCSSPSVTAFADNSHFFQTQVPQMTT